MIERIKQWLDEEPSHVLYGISATFLLVLFLCSLGWAFLLTLI